MEKALLRALLAGALDGIEVTTASKVEKKLDPLVVAVMEDNGDKVKELVQANTGLLFASLEHPKEKGERTPLQLAAEFGKNTVVEVLLQEAARIKADILGVCNKFLPPLAMALASYQFATADLLIKNGAKIDLMMTNSKHTAAHQFTKGDNVLALNYLLERGVSVDVLDEDGDTLLINACYLTGNETPWTAICGLLERKIKVDAVNKNGETALSVALRKGNQKLVAMLLLMGDADPTVGNTKILLENPTNQDKADLVRRLVQYRNGMRKSL